VDTAITPSLTGWDWPENQGRGASGWQPIRHFPRSAQQFHWLGYAGASRQWFGLAKQV